VIGEIKKDIFKEVMELSSVYLYTKDYEDNIWRVARSGYTPIMSRDHLVNIVKDKEIRARNYEQCDSYWLLVIVDFINPAQDQEIVIDSFDTIQTEVFGKVIVYKTLFGHILEAK
jgi:hypothetical protein